MAVGGPEASPGRGAGGGPGLGPDHRAPDHRDLPGTPADKFDVKPGDILVSINDQPVQSRSDAINIAQRIDPNSTG